MPRIKKINGDKPFLVIAPHGGGPTDIRSARMSEIIAEETKSFAIINTGWIRPWKGYQEGSPNTSIDVKEDIPNGFANLNDLQHARQNPVKQEFLKPLDDYKNLILQNYKQVYIFLIHGFDDIVRDYAGVDMVVGYGAGDPPKHSCSLTFKDRFISCLAMYNFSPAQGKAGGRLSAWGSNNLNQLYNHEQRVTSIQIEIGLTLRDTDKKAEETALRVAEVINKNMSAASIPFIKKILEK